MDTKRILLLLGGTYHDFEGFTDTVVPATTRLNSIMEVTYDPNVLLQLNDIGIDVVTMYTCLGDTEQEDTVGKELTAEQTAALVKFVRNGGGLLGIHGATVISDANQGLIGLFGARFHTHPPPFTFTVSPRPQNHPVIDAVPAFEVHDEFYLHRCRDPLEVLMTGQYEGKTHPLVWTRSAGNGRVAYIALGHGPAVWRLPAYQQLVRQALGWLAVKEG